ncbi:MAG: sugar transferase [Pseudomonadota bacterium]|nr:sugar transferase [Pseudomonadota bacterium]
MKRLLDIVLACLGLLFSAPLLLLVMLLAWLQDGHPPLYVAPRVGRGGTPFRMVKLRSMVPAADASGVDSTGAADPRITRLGHFIRRYKLDELTQLWNVLTGDMSLVGPRPNVRRETDLYTREECRLLSVRPGITDFASIVFADEGEILCHEADPDLAYNQLIRPWKSRLGLVYVDRNTVAMDLRLIALTLLALLSRRRALAGVRRLLASLGVEQALLRAASREEKLQPFPPPGANEIVKTRSGGIA